MGSNGSGKTTIIEALKYATTGEQPPNSKGGAFIHDPSVCGEQEVNAQVKLSFQSTGRANMVMTRSLRLSVKKSTRQSKTLDCNLLMVREGERTNITSRVAELDQMMPQYLGVSKAILEAVIFCHQDDSLWPMSEPASLKKRFDEIFEAQKYTKAIDNIKQLRKAQNEELGKHKIHEEYAKKIKDKADKAEKQSRQLDEELDKLRKELENLNSQMDDAEKKGMVARDHAAKYTEVIEKLKALTTHRDWYNQQLNTIKVNLQERPESDEWLESELSQYEQRVEMQQRRQDEQTRRYGEIDREIADFRQKQSEKRVEHGKYEQQKATHEKRIHERDAEIKRCASRNNLRGYDMELDDMQINEFMDKLAALSKYKTSELEQLRATSRNKGREIQESLDELRENQSALKETRKAAKEQLGLNDQRISTFYRKLDQFSVDESGKATLESEMEDLDLKLQKAKRQLAEGGVDVKIKNAKKEIQEYEDEAKTLNYEFIESSGRATEVVKLDHLRKEAKERQRSLDTMKDAYATRFKKLLHADWQPAKLDAHFQQVMEQKKGETDKAKSDRDAQSEELSQVKFKLSTVSEQIKETDANIKKCAAHIRENTGREADEYPEILGKSQHDCDTHKADVEGFVPMQNFIKGAIEMAMSEHPSCRLCQRKLGPRDGARESILRLEKTFSDEMLEKYEQDFEVAKKDLEQVKEASQSYDTWKRLSDEELPRLQNDRLSLEQQRRDLDKRLEQKDQIVDECVEEQREVELLTKPVANVGKCFDDLRNLQAQIKTLENESQAAGHSRSLEDVKDRLEQIEEPQKAARTKLSKLENEDKQLREHVNALLLSLERVKNKLTTAKHELQEQTSLNNQVADLKKTNQQQRELMGSIDKQLEEVGPEITAKKTQLEDAYNNGAEAERALQKDVNQFADDLRNLQRTYQEIQAYIEGGGSANLSRCQREISTLESQISSLQTELKQVTVEINKIRDELKDQDTTKRIITDNLNYRKMQREFQSTEAEIERLSAQNADVDQAKHTQEAEKWERQYDAMSRERAAKMATANAKDEKLKELLQEWETDYKDARQNHRQAHIMVETTKAAVEDLGRYGGALDKAIMKYHSLKMEQINRTIQELWQATYQGTDVDTIRIRSDNESASKGNRSTNYRVCMLKQDAELDMRGRCSAGQKVLASIIIRLALAECFGEYCGLIALDEPTTNLDRDNIKSLAESLHAIIKQRRAQRNFQLIVITHDEEFLRYMKCQDFCDNYYRVYRDERQKSRIERQRIAEVL